MNLVQYDHLSLIQCKQTFTMVRIYPEIREITRRGSLKQNRTCLMTYLALSAFKQSSVSCKTKQIVCLFHKMFCAVLFPREFAFS